MRDYDFYYTQDGSIGLYSYKDDDVFHSKYGALTEAWEKFILPSNIDEIINTQSDVNVLDLCYGVGYNTKALMTYVINYYIKKMELEKNEKKLLKKIKNFIKKNMHKKNNIEAIYNDNNSNYQNLLSEPIEMIEKNSGSKFFIDCLDIDENLIKISPLLKTVITPQEIFTRFVPKIFDCFDTYWVIKKFLQKNAFKFVKKNKKEITELLNLKFGNEHELLGDDYRIHKFVNYILVDKISEQYKKDFLTQQIKKIIKIKDINEFFDKSLIKYAKYKHKFLYKIISKVNLFTFLHNIYYDHLSRRYKNAKFNNFSTLFKISFIAGDARKTLPPLRKQYDLIFLDAFTFSKAPELWTFEFLSELERKLTSRGIIITYSNSALVRNTFLANNLYVGKIINPKTKKSIGTVASKEKSMIKFPLTNYEIGLCNTKAGIPYHDVNLSSSREEILKNRENDFKMSELNSSSKYFKERGRKS